MATPVINHRDPQLRERCIRWADRVFLTDVPVRFLDSETTGLYDAEMCEIAITDREENVLLDTLLMPERPEKLLEVGKGKKCAADIHGITPQMLIDANAPKFQDIYPQLCEILDGTVLVIFNAEYDWGKIIVPACARLGVELPRVHTVTCAMLNYSNFIGSWDDYHQSYTYQKLPQREGVQAHRALGDVLSTIEMVRKLREGQP